uniref:Uncharacterized protein n=1 Tax=Ciona savignyi TaxID=51511 RepID=H2Z3A8_CIOSA
PLHSSPKPGSSKSNSLDKNEAKIGLKDPESRLDGPTPPPRPHAATSQETPQTQELFADFSNFNKPHE